MICYMYFSLSSALMRERHILWSLYVQNKPKKKTFEVTSTPPTNKGPYFGMLSLSLPLPVALTHRCCRQKLADLLVGVLPASSANSLHVYMLLSERNNNNNIQHIRQKKGGNLSFAKNVPPFSLAQKPSSTRIVSTCHNCQMYTLLFKKKGELAPSYPSV